MLDREYKELNSDIKPDKELIENTRRKMLELENHRACFQPKWLLCCGAGALALVLTATILLTYILLPGGIQTIDRPYQSGSSETASPGGNDVMFPGGFNTDIPEWYTPGSLRVTAVSNETGVTAMNTGYQTMTPEPLGITDNTDFPDELELPAGYRISEWSYWVGKDYLWVVPENEKGEHGKCSHLYFDRNSGEIICMYHLAEELAGKAGLLKDGCTVSSADGNPKTGDCWVTLFDQKLDTISCYIVNSEGKAFRIPVKYSKNRGMAFCFSEDHQYLALIDYQGAYRPKSTVWLIKLDGGEAEISDITKASGQAYETGENIRFSPGGRFLIYNVLSDTGGFYHDNAYEDWVVYDTVTGFAFRGRGEFLRYIRDNTAAVVETPEEIVALDLCTGTEIADTASLSASEQVRLERIRYFSAEYGYAGRLTLKSCFDRDRKDIVLRENVNVAYEKDGYIYMYTHGDEAVECYSIETGESFFKPVNREWLEEVSSYNDLVYIDYNMSLNLEGTEVLLTYTVSENRTSEQSDEENFIAEFQWSDCLADMEDFIKLPPENGLEATYQLQGGDGFTAITFTGVYSSYTAVEDYRDRTFTLYQYSGVMPQIYKNYFLSPSIPFRKGLSKEASQEKTLSLFQNMEVAEAPYDFGALYQGDTIDPDKSRRLMMQQILDTRPYSSVQVIKFPLEEAGENYLTNDVSLYYDIIELAMNKEVFEPITAEELALFDYSYNNGTRYEFSGMGPDEYPGIRLWRSTDGRPYVACFGYVFITEEEYDSLIKRFQEVFHAAKESSTQG